MKDIFDISNLIHIKKITVEKLRKQMADYQCHYGTHILRLRIAMAVSLFSVLQRIMMEHGERQD